MTPRLIFFKGSKVTVSAAKRSAHVLQADTDMRNVAYRRAMPSFDILLGWLVSVIGVATGAAYIPQALRIWKRRSSDDVSILTYLLFLGGQIVYLVYGIRIRQWPLIVGMAANIVGSLAVILSALRFRAAKQ